jgi:hypothetical protein
MESGWVGNPAYGNLASIDGSKLDQVHRVEGDASIHVNVNAPHGTSVRASSSGIFKRTHFARQTQMPLAQSGPATPASGFQE